MNTGTIALAAMAALLPVVVLLKRKVKSSLPPPEPDTSWDRLTAAYGAEDVTDKSLIERVAGKVGFGYTGVGADAGGLLLWLRGYKGARIPWGEITLVPGRFMDAPALRVEAAKARDVSIILPRRLEEKLVARAGAAWPGVRSRTETVSPGGGA